MLPSHLIDPSKKKNERLGHTRLGQAPPAPLPSLCVTGAMCQNRIFQFECGGNQISIASCVFRPRQLHDPNRPPLVVIHGGPSVPSNYLLPIVNGVTDRAIVFYDQWGCGKSSRPINDKETPFSISTHVQHFHRLVKEQWKLSKFHLLGHSFGGILAYEYLVKQQQQQQDSGIESPSSLSSCQSLILASTPTSSSLIQGETKRLYREIAGICIGAEELEEEDPATRQENSEAFRQTHECRLVQTPLALMDSMAQAGPTSWRGIQAIADYEATQKISNIPSLVLVGEYDFCTEPCVQGWSDLITDPTPQQQTLANCSHYGMLEDERQYGKAISEFLHQQERK